MRKLDIMTTPSTTSPMRRTWRRLPRQARRIGVAVAGTAVLLAGVALIVLPGPAVLIIPLGFAILATEFHWARKLVARARAYGRRFERRFVPAA